MNTTITFNLGDIAYTPEHRFTGEITEFKENDGIEYIILVNPNDGHRCAATLRSQSLNSLMPCYLQLVCTKAEYESICQKEVFGHQTREDRKKLEA